MQWHKAFQLNNAVIASKVARELRSSCGFEVTIFDGHIHKITCNGSTWVWNPRYSVAEMADQICDVLQVTRWWRDHLDHLFPEILTIGKYTKLPLPRDIVKPPPAAASSLSVKEDSRLLPLPEGVTAMRIGDFVNLITRS